MISVSSFSPHLSLRIPKYASLSLGWSPTHQVPSMSYHDCVFDNSGRACAADVAITSAAIAVRSPLFTRMYRTAPNRASARSTASLSIESGRGRSSFWHPLVFSEFVAVTEPLHAAVITDDALEREWAQVLVRARFRLHVRSCQPLRR